MSTSFETMRSHQKRPAVHFHNVGLKYGNHNIFAEASFSISPGSFHFLTGSSGAGKSSLIKLMYMGMRPYQGSVSLFGRDTRTIQDYEIPFYRQKIGVVFQDGFLLDHLNVIDNVALPLRIRGEPQYEAREKALGILQWVGLGDRVDVALQALSGGERQRVVIARAVIAKPSLLLADEATGNVDDKTASEIMHLFQELNRAGTTVIFATHNRDLLRTFPHPFLHIEKGRVVHKGPVKPVSHTLSNLVNPTENTGLKEQFNVAEPF